MQKKYSSDESRQQRFFSIIESNGEIETGSITQLPLPLSDLLQITDQSPITEEVIDSGLTARIYRIWVNDNSYALKLRRDRILVQNNDGQCSFINEVERRLDFENLKKKNDSDFDYHTIIDTIYGSRREGIILSPWIEGSHEITWDSKTINNLFTTLYHIETAGIFEWDLCPGNMILDTSGDIILYDFGYCYRFNPMIEHNSAGLSAPLFHHAERFETRAFMQYLMDLSSATSNLMAVKLYRIEKEIAINWYEKRLRWLEQSKADRVVTTLTRSLITRWESGLSTDADLDDLYMSESHRSYVLDMGDDLHGKTCTRQTIKKIDRIIDNIKNHHGRLVELGALFFGDEKLTRDDLLAKYRKNRDLAVSYQVS
jgi:hypothetical protein